MKKIDINDQFDQKAVKTLLESMTNQDLENNYRELQKAPFLTPNSHRNSMEIEFLIHEEMFKRGM